MRRGAGSPEKPHLQVKNKLKLHTCMYPTVVQWNVSILNTHSREITSVQINKVLSGHFRVGLYYKAHTYILVHYWHSWLFPIFVLTYRNDGRTGIHIRICLLIEAPLCTSLCTKLELWFMKSEAKNQVQSTWRWQWVASYSSSYICTILLSANHSGVENVWTKA